MKSPSINDALLAYKSYLESTEKMVKAKQIYSKTKSAIVRHLIAGWDESLMPKSSRQPTKTETTQIQEFLEKTPVSKLNEALEVQERVFEKYNVTQSSRNVYKSRLENLINWVRKQGWIESGGRCSSSRRNPKMRHGHGIRDKKRLTNRATKLDNYSLKTHSSWNTQKVKKLVEEVNQFHEYLVNERYPGRLAEPVKPLSARDYVKHLYEILGWLVNYKHIQPEKLNLNLLVPTSLQILNKNLNLMAFPKAQEKFIKQNKSLGGKIGHYVDIWICELLTFLEKERCCQSKRSLRNVLFAIHAFIRYQYIGQTKDANYKDIPAIVEINKHILACNKAIKNQKPIANIEMKWLELDQVHQQIVEPLRLECEFQNFSGLSRPIPTIVGSFRKFIVWGLLTYRAPRRQQELRELKIALYCQIEDKPKNLSPNQFIHPLSCDRDTDKYHGYLYKDTDGKWYQDITLESYKTGKSYKHQKLPIPDKQFIDGQSFYDYLEAYLYGYWRDKKGNWVSAGNTTEAPSAGHKLYALQMALRPESNDKSVSHDDCNTTFHKCDFVFVSRRKGTPLSDTTFGSLYKNSAYRLTGQLLTPHLLRDIYASWFLDREYTEDVIRSLAYAMGHSVEELRGNYDKRKAQRKHEPIQKNLDETLNQLPGFNEQTA